MHIRIPSGVSQQIEVVLTSQSSERIALKLRRLLDEAYQQIELFPESGRKQSFFREDMRVILVDSYRLIYMIDYEADEIILISFVHSALPGDALE